jgi:hypothetical protein
LIHWIGHLAHFFSHSILVQLWYPIEKFPRCSEELFGILYAWTPSFRLSAVPFAVISCSDGGGVLVWYMQETLVWQRSLTGSVESLLDSRDCSQLARHFDKPMAASLIQQSPWSCSFMTAFDVQLHA